MIVRTIPPGAPEMPLADAAIALAEPWHRTWRRLLTGELTGRRRGRNWLVTSESVRRVRDAKSAASERGNEEKAVEESSAV